MLHFKTHSDAYWAKLIREAKTEQEAEELVKLCRQDAVNDFIFDDVFFLYDEDAGVHFVERKEIICIVANKNDPLFYITGRDKSKPLHQRCTMDYLEEELTPFGFYRLNRSYLIELKFIDEIDKEDTRVRMKNDLLLICDAEHIAALKKFLLHKED